MYLGIDENTGLIYEGSGNPDIPSIPLPTVTQAKLIEKELDWNDLPRGMGQDPFRWIFREDSFDAVSRTRRGRLYQPWGNQQPHDMPVCPHPYDALSGLQPQPSQRPRKRIHVYVTCSDLLNRPGKGLGEILALGTAQAVSAWRIVQIEMVASRAVMVTLKSLSAFGILPAVDEAKIRAEFRPAVAQALNRVLDASFRESPISVIDQCRNAVTVLISRWLAQQNHGDFIIERDLAEVARIVGEKPYEKFCASNLGKTVALLHPRGKSNEQIPKNLRFPVDEDAELALHAVGFLVRDFGWAKSIPLPAA